MCLAIPGRLMTWVDRDPLLATGWVEFEGVRRLCHLACTIEADEGDYLLVHAGIALGRVDTVEALRLLGDLRRLGEPTAPQGARVKYVDEFRDPDLARGIVDAIRRRATRKWTIMEVCGGQTHNLLRYGIDEVLADAVALVHGPGCPVCVTGQEVIDRAIELSLQPGVHLAMFGDMLRVPGSRLSLAQARAQGARVLPVYAPSDALRFAEGHPDVDVVFFAVGFETTIPATALAVLQADRLGVNNFSLLSAHVRVQPAMASLMAVPDIKIDGFLAAGHVCTVLGYESYVEFCEQYKTPVVVTGFEPVDLLTGILACVEQLEAGEHRVANAYNRNVIATGNQRAQSLIDEVFKPCDRRWRGLGVIRGGGFGLRSRWCQFDADERFHGEHSEPAESHECRAGEVLTGTIKPTECQHFGITCHPDRPLGAPMVSSEGACAAYYHYHRSVSPVMNIHE